jgi:hypothetical protein
MFSRPCPDHGGSDAADPQRWISSHKTSIGMVLYYRCRCGQVAVTTLDVERTLAQGSGEGVDRHRHLAAGKRRAASAQLGAPRG